jgi:hypothetical protein
MGGKWGGESISGGVKIEDNYKREEREGEESTWGLVNIEESK